MNQYGHAINQIPTTMPMVLYWGIDKRDEVTLDHTIQYAWEVTVRAARQFLPMGGLEEFNQARADHIRDLAVTRIVGWAEMVAEWGSASHDEDYKVACDQAANAIIDIGVDFESNWNRFIREEVA